MATACVFHAIKLAQRGQSSRERFVAAQLALIEALFPADKHPTPPFDMVAVRAHLESMWDDFLTLAQPARKVVRIPIASLCPNSDPHAVAQEEGALLPRKSG